MLAQDIPQGFEDESFLANDVTLPEDSGKEIRAVILTWPAQGVFAPREDGSFTYDATGVPDGVYTFTYQLQSDGDDVGDPETGYLTVGDPGSTATPAAGAATVTASGSAAFAASGTAAPGVASVAAGARSTAAAAAVAAQGLATVAAISAGGAGAVATAAAGAASVSAAGAARAATIAAASAGSSSVAGPGAAVASVVAVAATGAAVVSAQAQLAGDITASAVPAAGSCVVAARGSGAQTPESQLFLALAPLVAGRMYPVRFPQEPRPPAWPALRYTFIATTPKRTNCGTGSQRAARSLVQIDIVQSEQAGYMAMRALRLDAIAAMKTLEPTWSLVADRELPFEPVTKTFRCSLDYAHMPSTPAI